MRASKSTSVYVVIRVFACNSKLSFVLAFAVVLRRRDRKSYF